MAIRIHIIATRSATADDFDKVLGEGGISAGPARESSGWAFAVAGVFGNSSDAIDSLLKRQAGPAFRVTTVDGAEWHLVAFADGRRVGAWRRNFLSGTSSAEAEALVDGLAGMGIRIDRASLVAALMGALSEEDRDDLGDIGDLPRFLECLGIENVLSALQDFEQRPAACPPPRPQTAAAAQGLAQYFALFREAELESLDGGSFALEIARLAALIRAVVPIGSSANAAVKFALPVRFDPVLGGPVPCDFAIDHAAVAPAVFQRGRSLVAMGILTSADPDTLAGWMERVAGQRSSLPDGAGLEVFLAIADSASTLVPACAYSGEVDGGRWVITHAWPPTARQQLEQALA